MKLHHLVVDDFFENPMELRLWALAKGFRDEQSPVDGYDYRGVCKDPPWVFKNEAEIRLSYLMRSPAEIKLAFLRLAMEGVNPTRRLIHLDPMYSTYLCTVYLNPPGEFPIYSGTSMFRHLETGLEITPSCQEEIDTWDKDCNDLNAWQETGKSVQEWNRAVILPTYHYHAAMPPGGFGYDPESGRMVFVAFFNI
ncbi:MAG: hypothetical protein C5B60_03845 [Chloroflexi bacterium]|nr:MAG: hypothetical protein C5B60_03845 [Chloroflexota bacterium]